MSTSTAGRLLVVDDNRTSRLLLERRLSAEGYDVRSAGGGAEALELLLGTPAPSSEEPAFDLAVLDVVMPEVDGLTVLRRVREVLSPSDLPIVMATAKEETADIVAALKSGANDYVVKPINFPVLLARIDTQLALREARLAIKHAQRSLIDTAKMESVGYLAAGVAHEIRNPLARIQLGIQSLARSPAMQADEKLLGKVEAIKASCDKADQVVGGLMQVAAESRPRIEEIALGPVVRDAVDLQYPIIEDHGIVVRIEIDPETPAAQASSSELRQVLANVVLNAVQAMPKGGVLTIRTGTRILEAPPSSTEGRSGNTLRQGDELPCIEIEDSGPGIPEGKLLTVFDAFYTTKPTGIATGLGLTIAKKILDLQGGTILLENREEGGARATILLPRAGGFRTTV